MSSFVSSEEEEEEVNPNLSETSIGTGFNSPTERSFNHAVWHGQLNVVRKLIEEGAMSDEQVEFGFMQAASRGHLEIVQFLFGKGINVNSQDYTGEYALMSASRRGHQNIVHFLLENRAQVNVWSDSCEGGSAISYALEAGHRDIVKLLVENGASIDHVNKIFLLAVQLDDIYVVRYLVKKGADMKTIDPEHPDEDVWSITIRREYRELNNFLRWYVLALTLCSVHYVSRIGSKSTIKLLSIDLIRLIFHKLVYLDVNMQVDPSRLWDLRVFEKRRRIPWEDCVDLANQHYLRRRDDSSE